MHKTDKDMSESRMTESLEWKYKAKAERGSLHNAQSSSGYAYHRLVVRHVKFMKPITQEWNHWSTLQNFMNRSQNMRTIIMQVKCRIIDMQPHGVFSMLTRKNWTSNIKVKNNLLTKS